ncbi:MAG: HNH endonuclease [Pseudomonadales bacterium]|nr:HNH endonuclease [Pseudomonadales bacterium]
MKILRLNKAGLPVCWVTQEEAATLCVKQQVVWSLGDTPVILHGGYNKRGCRSTLSIPSIIACDGDTARHSLTPALSNRTLFRRDDHFCLYCGKQFTDKLLTRDHVVPVSQGGKNHWHNVVAACQRCNNFKGGKTPEQAGMELLAVPFTPNIYEFMYLSNRQIVGDLMEYLRARFRSANRYWQAA